MAAMDLGEMFRRRSIFHHPKQSACGIPWGGGRIGNWWTAWSTVSSAPHSQAAERPKPFLCKRKRKRPTPVRMRFSQIRCSGQGHSRSVGAKVGDKSTVNRSAVQPLCIPSVIHPELCACVVVVRWTDVLLCCGCKCVFWYPLD